MPQDGGGSSNSRQSATDARHRSFERKIIIAIAVEVDSALYYVFRFYSKFK